MRLSVIVPVYNGEKYLKRCINSLVCQDVDSFEIIIVNDGSTDGTKKIAEEYQNTYSNVVLINIENSGAAQARKTGLEYAKGNYIGFVDVDDWVEKNMYSELLYYGGKYDADIVCCNFFKTYSETEEETPSCFENTEEVLTGKEAMIYLHRRQKVYTYLWNKIYKKKLFEDIIFPSGNFIGEDYYIGTQILSRCENVIWIPKSYYHYVEIVGSASRGGYTDNYKLANRNYKERILELSNMFPEQQVLFENYYMTEIMSFIVAMGKNNNYDKKMISQVVSYVRKHIKQYLSAEYISFRFKVSAIFIALYYKVVIWGYRCICQLRIHL